jgi:hypothetical protein
MKVAQLSAAWLLERGGVERQKPVICTVIKQLPH